MKKRLKFTTKLWISAQPSFPHLTESSQAASNPTTHWRVGPGRPHYYYYVLYSAVQPALVLSSPALCFSSLLSSSPGERRPSRCPAIAAAAAAAGVLAPAAAATAEAPVSTLPPRARACATLSAGRIQGGGLVVGMRVYMFFFLYSRRFCAVHGLLRSPVSWASLMRLWFTALHSAPSLRQ